MTDLATPIDRYLAEQRDATAVGRFARWHQEDHGSVLAELTHYRELVPLERPGPGEQYAFEVDLDSCTGCKACVSACNHMNGLDDGESWRSVGLLVGSRDDQPFQQAVTTGCHHCEEPACLSGCPVNAYEKNAETGIVHHLDDQCIGCRYCILMCPYEVPKFSDRLGIVRKCDMCSGRLAAGEAPACAQACPNGAIRITVVSQTGAARGGDGGTMVPGAPDSRITLPATVYRTTRPALLASEAADRAVTEPAHNHPPLVVMLVLTQLSVGAFATDFLLTALSRREVAGAFPAAFALATGLLALGASLLHLGRPRYAYRAVVGLRHSWLSREIVAFGGFAAAAVAYAAVRWLQPGAKPLTLALGALVLLTGAAGVGCSVMIYAVTKRTWWRASVTTPRFILSGAVSGVAAVLAASLVAAALRGAGALPALTRPLALTVVAATVAKLLLEAEVLRNRRPESPEDLARTARLLRGPLRTLAQRRVAAGVAGGVVAPGILALLAASPRAPVSLASGLAVAGALLVLAGELWERTAFFRAVAAPRMPGGPA